MEQLHILFFLCAYSFVLYAVVDTIKNHRYEFYTVIEKRLEFNQYYEEVFREVRYQVRRHKRTCVWYRKKTSLVVRVTLFRRKGKMCEMVDWVELPFKETKRLEMMLQNTE